MRALLLAFLIGLAAPAFAQDALRLALQSVPGASALAGSPQNLASLMTGLTTGAPVRLVAPGPAGFNRVIAFTPRAVTPAQAVALLAQMARDFDLAGVARPSPEQLAAALVG
jgi:hypothetical protein